MIKSSQMSIILLIAFHFFLSENANANILADDVNSTLLFISDNIKVDTLKERGLFRKEGFGKRKWRNGRSYVGELRYGRPHGRGTFRYEDGGIYKGTFQKGRRFGWGEYQFPKGEGEQYEGEWFNGKMHGNGALIFKCGHQYIGEFYYGEMDGEGTILLASGESYSGQWREGLADGYGIFSHIDGSKYAGLNRKGKRHGEGKLVWMNGDSLIGIWTNGNLHGKSTLYFNNGDQYNFRWAKGEWIDEGTYVLKSGISFVGPLKVILQKIEKNTAEYLPQNISLIYYSIAMEYHSNHQYDYAMELMQQADKYTPTPSSQKQLIAMQLEQIRSKKGGWAQLTED